MQPFRAGLIFALLLASLACAQAQPNTTRPNVVNLTVSPCTSGVPIVGGGAAAAPICAVGVDLPASGILNVTTGFRIAGAATSGNGLRGNGTNFVSAQFACSDLSGVAASCATDATNASNISSGTLAYARGGRGVPVRATSAPSNPTGTASTTLVMAGLAGSFTPATSGNMFLATSWTSSNSAGSDGCAARLAYGTGTAPTNGAAQTGTLVGGAATITTSSVANQFQAGSNVGYVTGLTVSTAYWYDLAFEAITGGTCSLANITLNALEQ